MAEHSPSTRPPRPQLRASGRPSRRFALLVQCAWLIALSLPCTAQGATPAPADTLFVEAGSPPTLHSAGSSVVLRADLQGHHTRLLVLTGAGAASGLARSPDGLHVAYVLNGTSLWQMDAGGGHRRRIYAVPTDVYARLSAPRYSPDGRTIGFTVGCCARFSIYSIGSDGTHLRTLSSGGVRFLQDWSPDGKQLLFTLDGQLWAAEARGAHAHRLGGDATDAGSFFDVRYSPDGSHLVAALRPSQQVAEASGRVIALLHPDGQYLTILTRDLPLDAGLPSWSPDGKRIAFVVASGAFGPQGRLHDLWVMRFDGTQRRNVSHGLLGDVGAVAWAR